MTHNFSQDKSKRLWELLSILLHIIQNHTFASAIAGVPQPLGQLTKWLGPVRWCFCSEIKEQFIQYSYLTYAELSECNTYEEYYRIVSNNFYKF